MINVEINIKVLLFWAIVFTMIAMIINANEESVIIKNENVPKDCKHGYYSHKNISPCWNPRKKYCIDCEQVFDLDGNILERNVKPVR